jgi:hypothetical protein
MSEWIAAIWAFLTNEANERALALVGSFFLGLWSVAWGVFVYICPPKSGDGEHARPSDDLTTASRRRPRGVSPMSSREDRSRKWSVASVMGAPAFKIWVAGMVVALGSYLGWRTYLDQPTLTANFRVCRGEYENLCPPHDVFVGCGDLNVWATNECLKFNATTLSSRDGNKCGYTVINFSCSKKLTR